MTERISVTEVRNALRCPRIFALGRLRKKAVAFPVGSSCLGATFHRVVERFHRTVDRPPAAFEVLAAGAPRDDVETELAAWLLAIAVEELAGDPSYASIPAEVDDLAEALRELARHLAGRLTRFEEPPARALARLVQAGERPVEARLDPEGALVHGRIDALFRDPSGALEVVEYKLTDVANDELDRAQVALYRELLRVSEGLSARPTVLRFTPTLRESAASAGATDHWVQSSLRPLLRSMVGWAAAPTQAPATDRRDLCAACPTARDCSEVFPAHLAPRDDPPMAAARPRPEGETLGESTPVGMTSRGEADAEGRREAEGIQHRIVEELQRQGTAVKCPRPAIVGPTLYLIEVARLRGPVSHLDRAAEDVVHRLAAEDGVEIEYRKEGGHRWFYVRRREPRRVELSPLLEQKRQWLSASSGRFLVGQEPDGTIVGGDLGDASTPHLLIGGQSGSGKSVLIQAIIASLLHYHGPEAIRFTLVDPKRVTFIGPGFQAAVGAHLDGPIRYEVEDTVPILERLIDLMEERYRLFEAAKVADVGDYNEQASDRSEHLERRVLVIDEFQDLVADKASKEAFFAAIKRLGAKARAAGIHMILATQRPDAATVPGIIKANLGGKIALKVASSTNSRIILDQRGAETLFGKGDLLADLGRGPVRAQAPFLSSA